MFSLHPEWPAIIKRAWSIRFIVAAAVFSGAETAVGLIGDKLPFPPVYIAAASFVATSGAFLARILVQTKVPDDTPQAPQ